jgi:thioredoxin:protein disulfide reductase
MKRAVLCCALAGGLAWLGSAEAKPWWMANSPNNAGDFLPPDQAFQVSAEATADRATVRWVIADGYYLYRTKMDIAPDSPGLRLGIPEFPNGTMKVDEFFGRQEIYRQQVEVKIPLMRDDAGAHPAHFRVTYQGCADKGLCYEPIVKTLSPQELGRNVAAATGSRAVTQTPTPRWVGLAIIVGLVSLFLAGAWQRRKRPMVDG